MTISKHRATVGRVVWVWEEFNSSAKDISQAYRADVIYVYPDGRVNVSYTTHFGVQATAAGLEVHDPEPTDRHGSREMYATWMPFQKQQMDAQQQT